VVVSHVNAQDNDKGSLRDRVIIVTGASRGIGRGLALHLAKQGAIVVGTGRKPDRLATLEDDLAAVGAPYLCRPLNTADRAGAVALAAEVAERFGRIDGLVANAQTFRSVTPIEDVTEQDMNLLFDTGPKGTLWQMQAVFPYMREQFEREGRGGRIVTTGSNAGLLGAAGYGPYAASKEAIRALTRVTAREWGKYGILVNCVCPVSVAHRMPVTGEDDPTRRAMFEATFKDLPLGRDGDAEADLGPTIAFLLSDACSYMTGETLMLDGGALMRP
jgi:NAD(P)-dependent dehydrogenase (short-subunit alcohol dehydrogenase family)